MGKYIVVNDVLNTFKRIKDFYDKGFVSENQINIWINEAESIIEAKLSERYKLPLPSIPDIIKTLALELTEFFAEKELHTPTSSGDEVSWLYPRYDRVMSILDSLTKGEYFLTDSEGNILPISDRRVGLLLSNHYEVNQIFSMDDFFGIEIDKNYGKE